MDLDEVVDELYGLPPGEFTKARDTRAAAARQDGDRELAGQIKKLRRPTVSAWLANRLARDGADDLDRLLELADALHDAQERLAGDDLRRLTQQRRQVIGALATKAAAIARDRDQSVSGAVERELVETLEAALSDRTAADVLRSGRLTGPLSYAGLGVEDPTSVLAVAPTPGRPSARSARPGPPGRGAKPPAAADGAAGRSRAIAEARQVVDDAEQAAADAAKRAGREAKRVDGLRAEHAAVADRVDQARRALEALESEAGDTAAGLTDAEAALEGAEEAKAQADQALAEARAALAALEEADGAG